MADVRLIDANALKEYLGCDNDRKYSSMIMHEIADRIDEQPTIDAVPVVHGYWLYGDEYAGHHDVDCSVCGESARTYYDYCPNCGAKMDAKELDVPTKDGGAIDGN